MSRYKAVASLLVMASMLAGCGRDNDGALPVDADKANPQKRAALPEYRTIPAAADSELTPAIDQPGEDLLGWERSQGDAGNRRYSALDQITPANVGKLAVAWIYHSKDGAGNIQVNPAMANGVLYVPTPGKNIVALDGKTGRELWRFRPPFDTTTHLYGPAHRGLTYVRGRDGLSERLLFLANGFLFALDPKTGKPIPDFGNGGKVAAYKGPGSSSFLGASPPAIFGNIIVAANQNVIEGFDIRSGKPLWHFNTLTYPVADPARDNGGNVWSGIAMDSARGIVVAAVGDPHPNYDGTGRRGENRHNDSVVALDARNGKLLWAFQNIVHDIWDLDTAAPPNLVTISRNGKRVDAVAQVTKQGTTLLLDRLTGKPIFPFRQRRAPVSMVPGEYTWPYQPAPELPQPFSRQIFSRNDVTNISPQARAFVLGKLKSTRFGWFEPPNLNAPIAYYGVHGGSDWPGASFDPSTGWLYVAANEVAFHIRLKRFNATEVMSQASTRSPGFAIFQKNCAACHGQNRQGQGMVPSLIGLSQRRTEAQVTELLRTGRGAMPKWHLPDADRQALLAFLFDKDMVGKVREYIRNTPKGSLTIGGFDRLEDQDGYPGTRPPWGTLNAINLNTGRLMWQVPLGEYEELTRRGIPKTGTENFGGPIATAGGLIFVAGTRDKMIRAFDKATGRELWKYRLPFGGFAPPTTYAIDGRQYVVIAATGGGKLGGETGDAYVAFALPK